MAFMVVVIDEKIQFMRNRHGGFMEARRAFSWVRNNVENLPRKFHEF
jgi:hypothetical protein